MLYEVFENDENINDKSEYINYKVEMENQENKNTEEKGMIIKEKIITINVKLSRKTEYEVNEDCATLG